MDNYTKLRPKPIDDPDLITVLCPTRSRPELLIKTITSFDKFTINKDKVEFWLLIDEDDLDTHSLIHGDLLDDIDIKLSYHIGERPITLADGLNKLWQVAANGGIYFYMSDHYQMLTAGWDIKLREIFKLGPKDRLQVVQINDEARESSDTIFWALSAEWANIVGRFVPPYFPFWFIDMWIDHVSIILDRKVESDIFVKSTNQGPIGTTRLWHLGYWYRLYQVLLFERMQEVEIILEAIYKKNPIGYETAKLGIERRFQEYDEWARSMIDGKKIAKIESDHSGERNTPNGLYLKAFQSAHQYFLKVQPEFKQFNLRKTQD